MIESLFLIACICLDWEGTGIVENMQSCSKSRDLVI